MIVSTTVQNTDNDGILNAWKVPAALTRYTWILRCPVNEGKCNGPGDPRPGWISPEQCWARRMFIQLDYMCSAVTGNDSCNTSQVSG